MASKGDNMFVAFSSRCPWVAVVTSTILVSQHELRNRPMFTFFNICFAEALKMDRAIKNQT